MMYEPKPIDTQNIRLPEDLVELMEKISENVHENWSMGRIREGWTYGPLRDDNNRTHPCLVPYDQLSESEKEFDRTTAAETLKLILALGYTIEKK